jgi:hypothetical protein
MVPVRLRNGVLKLALLLAACSSGHEVTTQEVTAAAKKREIALKRGTPAEKVEALTALADLEDKLAVQDERELAERCGFWQRHTHGLLCRAGKGDLCELDGEERCDAARALSREVAQRRREKAQRMRAEAALFRPPEGDAGAPDEPRDRP